ncbi:DNA gyrase subunit A OS=Streptomyces tendae OX=1932 GN=gyrA PE=3 SV=1 [Streptomyces tendae]
MTDENTPVTTPEGHALAMRVEPVGLETEMQRSYLDYAMSVIVSRALPDVRDSLKPVHRRVLYAMYDGGYRPERGFYKCARVVGDVMGNYHPHGDSSIYDALVRLAQPWSMRMPLVDSNGNFGSPGNDPAAAMRYTECKMAPLSMEMVRDIDEETVDFTDNYDGRSQEPTVLPARFPNLLINGSAGIAVGMATNIPPHNLREVAAGAQWYLENHEASHEELLDALIERIKGPDFPTGALVVGRKGIEEAYRTGRGSITMRAVVEVEEIQNRQCLVVTELPYQTNPDNLAQKIADLVKDGKIGGIADVRDETSSRTGQRLVIVLKRDAVAKVVLNNLYKHTDLQTNFGANMLALVDGVPRTLSLDAFIRHWVNHQIEVIVRRTRFRLRKAETGAHPARSAQGAGRHRRGHRADPAQRHRRDRARGPDGPPGDRRHPGQRHPGDAAAPSGGPGAAEDRPRARRAPGEDHRVQRDPRLPGPPARDRRRGADRPRREVRRRPQDEADPLQGDMSIEDLIAEEDIVVTVTRGGYIKRTKTDDYRAQKRGGKGVRGAKLKEDDIVNHFFVSTTHHWLLFFTNKGRVYRAKASSCRTPAGTRAASTWRTCWPSSRTRRSPRSVRSATTRRFRTWSWPRRPDW